MEQLLNYIRQQPENIVLDIIADEDACRTYIKLLPPMAQQILFRILFIPSGFPVSDMTQWSPNIELVSEAYNELRTAHIVDEYTNTNNRYFVKIKPCVRDVLLDLGPKKEFKFQQMKAKVENPFLQPQNSLYGETKIKEEIPTDPNHFPTVPEDVLDSFAKDQLHNILSYMLHLTDDIDDEARKILSDSGLMEFGGNLVPDGHRFLLMSPKEQIWRIVQSYLNSTKDLISSLRFILQIGSMQLTRGYPISALPNFLEALIGPFNAIGLLYIHNNYFFPTKSILNFFGKSDIFKSEGWMFMDTNFKITAFPRSPLDTALLKKFAIVTYEFPGFASAFVSPNSFREALDQGTTLDDIIKFLETNLSKTIGSGRIPDAVQKQFSVWRDQRDRIVCYSNTIMRQYNNMGQANYAADVARSLNGLVFGPYFKQESQYYIVITRGDIESEYAEIINNMPDFTY